MALNDGIVIVGAGPVGLMAADVLSTLGLSVTLFERMPSVGRKFLLAGRGGLNLTHSEPIDSLLARYGDAAAPLAPIIRAFTPGDLVAWCERLGQPTFVGSSGRVFPNAMKASPLLRAWLSKLARQGVAIIPRACWRGWDDQGRLLFDGAPPAKARKTLLALGGASWPRLGGDGAWCAALAGRGVEIAPLRPSNMGFVIPWSTAMGNHAGSPLKSVALHFGDTVISGEAIITAYGIEGGAVYALSAQLRDALARKSPQVLHVDLRPRLSLAEVEAKLAAVRENDSTATKLRKALNLTPAAITLVHEAGPAPRQLAALAARVKAAPLSVHAPAALDRAISSAGGVRWSAVRETLELKALPGVYVAGEMLDWEAPTGGYLLQACFATGVWAARRMAEAR